MDEYLQRLSAIYKGIDIAYSEAQAHYNFSCEGCADNCCVTKFHHYTVIEELYLAEGLKKIAGDKIKSILARAGEVVKMHDSSDESIRVMCPLNENGLCMPYEHRPMICRIHGVPYELFRNFKVEYGEGCWRFIKEKEAEAKDFRLNRTGFYLDMAGLERDVRAKLNFTGRHKKTTAEMALDIFYGENHNSG